MLLALVVVVIAGTVQFIGPVQAVVNFTQTGTRRATDFLLCPNTIYTFRCEISGDLLLLRSFNSDGSLVNSFTVVSQTAPGATSNQTEFNFTALSAMNGLAATAVMNSSMNLSSVELDCSDSSDGSSSTFGTVVNRDPLDAVNNLASMCNFDPDVTQLSWDLVECATEYSLYVSGMGWFNTMETSYNIPSTNFSGEIFASGGSESVEFFVSCRSRNVTVLQTSGTLLVECDDCLIAIPTFKISSNTNIMTGYTIMFIGFPVGGSAYYETDDGRVEDITVADGVGEINIDSTNVTVYVTHENGTVYCSQELQEPSVSGEEIIVVFWILVVIVLLVIVLGVGGTITVIVIVKQKESFQGKSRNNIDLDPDVSELKTRGSDM